MKRTSFVALALVVASLVGGCKKGSTTTIPLSWKNPSFSAQSFNRLFVIGIGEDDGVRRLFEDTFAKAIAAEGTAAQASWGHLPQTTKLTEKQVNGAIERLIP